MPTDPSSGSTLVPCLRYRDAAAAIDWLCATFGFTRQAVYTRPDGGIAHAQLCLGRGMVMLGSVTAADDDTPSAWARHIRQPDELGGVETQSAYVVVTDADAVHARVQAAGVPVLVALHDEDYGGRGFTCRDPEGHIWSVGTYDPWHAEDATPAAQSAPAEPSAAPPPAVPERRLISSGSTYEAEIGYSRAVVDGDWIFVSGTTGVDYRTMSIPEGLLEQTEQCLQNIASALAQAGASLRDVVRVTYVLPDASEFPQCWPVLRRHFGESRPAAMMISAGLLNPRMRIEIEVTARRHGSAFPREEPPR